MSFIHPTQKFFFLQNEMKKILKPNAKKNNGGLQRVSLWIQKVQQKPMGEGDNYVSDTKDSLENR